MPIAPTYQLKENHIDIWLCQAEMMEKKVDYFFSTLSLEEKKRAERFKFEIHRQRFIISHGFKRSILGDYLKVSPSTIQFKQGEKGKPYLLHSEKSLQFNLSHTKDITIIALTKAAEVGIDIEHINRKTDWKAICQRFFTRSEQQPLFSLDQKYQKNAFYQLWTRKEAYMKLLGSGLSLSPTEFSLSVPPSPAELISHHSSKYLQPETVRFVDIKLPDKLNCYCASLASATSISKYNLYYYS